jgi:uncharacterized protein YkwD
VGAVAALALLTCVAGSITWAWAAANGPDLFTLGMSGAAPTATPSSPDAPSLTGLPPAPALPTGGASTPTTRRTPTRTIPRPTATPATGTTGDGCRVTTQDTAGEQHLLGLLNAHRAAAGVPPLALNATLAREARAHSCDMDQHQRLSHTGSDGSSPFDRMRAVGVTFTAAGENIGAASGFGLTAGLDADDRDMMAEPLTPGNHHWNIVNPAYTQVGLGVIYANGQLWFTEDFVG